jgi:hypothetical protein
MKSSYSLPIDFPCSVEERLRSPLVAKGDCDAVDDVRHCMNPARIASSTAFAWISARTSRRPAIICSERSTG